jgi:hypothetical protein
MADDHFFQFEIWRLADLSTRWNKDEFGNGWMRWHHGRFNLLVEVAPNRWAAAGITKGLGLP